MANACEKKKKNHQIGYNISHAHNKTKRRFTPNIQKLKVIINGQTKKINICTSCIKANKAQKAI